MSNMSKFKKIFLSETPLSSGELTKYDFRIPLFQKKIEDGTPFTSVDNGSDIYIKNTPENIDKLKEIEKGSLQGKIDFETKDGKTVSLRNILKTTEFGGGKGSGGGSDNTDLTESAQCAYCAVAQSLGEIKTQEDFLNAVDSVKSMFDTSASLSDIKTKLDSKWIKSSINTANVIVKLKEFKNKKFIFHRGSDFTNLIKSTFTKVKDTSAIKLSDINKWNPADIWAVNKSWNAEKEFKDANISTLLELSDFINLAYNEGNLIGISLKKVVSDKPPVKVFNKPDTENFDIKYKSFKISDSSKDIFSDSKDVYVFLDFHGSDIKIQFRTFNKATAWQGEIKGKQANAGKIGGGIIISILSYLGKTLDDSNVIRTNWKAKNNIFAKDFFSLYKKYYVEKIDFEEFKEKLYNPENLDYVVSKYQGLKLIDTLSEMNDDDKNEAIKNIVSYAFSATSVSSVFIKIGE